MVIDFYWLDFSYVINNEKVKDQGKVFCIKTKTKGYFSPLLERYPTRQDLAKITRANVKLN